MKNKSKMHPKNNYLIIGARKPGYQLVDTPQNYISFVAYLID